MPGWPTSEYLDDLRYHREFQYDCLDCIDSVQPTFAEAKLALDATIEGLDPLGGPLQPEGDYHEPEGRKD